MRLLDNLVNEICENPAFNYNNNALSLTSLENHMETFRSSVGTSEASRSSLLQHHPVGHIVLWFNFDKVKIHELRPEVIAEDEGGLVLR